MLALLLLTSTTAHAACPSTFSDVQTAIDGALDSYDRGLIQEFRAHQAALSEDLPCLQGMLEPDEVRAILVVQLLEAWGRKDRAATAATLHALLDLDPGFNVGTEVKLSDMPLQEFLAQSEAGHLPPEQVPVPLVPWSTWHVNGDSKPGTPIPVGRPAVVQLLDTREGKVLTWYLDQGGLPPGFETPEDASDFDWSRVDLTRLEPPEKVRRAFKSERFLCAGAGVAGAVAIAGLGTAAWFARSYGQCRDTWDDTSCSTDQINAWVDWNDRLLKGGIAAGGAAALLGAGAVVTWRF